MNKRDTTTYQAVYLIRSMECTAGPPTTDKRAAVAEARRLKKKGFTGVQLKINDIAYEAVK
ncbi:MAG: hypothetical protein VXW22_02310 [Pseudomonadota bacterium]|nr:hypothetical protein [Pseudomonadota bacterium]